MVRLRKWDQVFSVKCFGVFGIRWYALHLRRALTTTSRDREAEILATQY